MATTRSAPAWIFEPDGAAITIGPRHPGSRTTGRDLHRSPVVGGVGLHHGVIGGDDEVGAVQQTKPPVDGLDPADTPIDIGHKLPVERHIRRPLPMSPCVDLRKIQHQQSRSNLPRHNAGVVEGPGILGAHRERARDDEAHSLRWTERWWRVQKGRDELRVGEAAIQLVVRRATAQSHCGIVLVSAAHHRDGLRNELVEPRRDAGDREVIQDRIDCVVGEQGPEVDRPFRHGIGPAKSHEAILPWQGPGAQGNVHIRRATHQLTHPGSVIDHPAPHKRTNVGQLGQ